MYHKNSDERNNSGTTSENEKIQEAAIFPGSKNTFLFKI